MKRADAADAVGAPSPQASRLPSKIHIDTLRGLACLLLVGFHVVGYNAATGLQLPDTHLLSRVNDALALVRIPLFSFLSGFVYALRPMRGPVVPFLRGKTRRLLVPLLLVGTGFALLQSITPGTNSGAIDWRLLHVVPVAHFWFLEALFLVFMLLAVLERLHLLDSPGRFALVWLAAAVLQLTRPLPVYFGLEGAAFLLPFLLLGLAGCRFHALLSRPAVLVAAAGVLAAIALGASAGWIPGPQAPSPLALASSVCVCVLLLAARVSIQWLAWVGSWSFGIYLFHPVFTAASRMALLRLGVGELAVLLVAGLVAGLAGSIALIAVLRRLPLGHLPLGERSRKSRVPAASGGAADRSRG